MCHQSCSTQPNVAKILYVVLVALGLGYAFFTEALVEKIQQFVLSELI
jgi:hypothetical protein